MADIRFKQKFSHFIFAILFQAPLPTPASFSTIIKAKNTGWLGNVVPAFACASNWEWRRQLSVFPCISPVWILFSPEHWDPWGGGVAKRRDMGHVISSTCHGGGASACVLMDPWSTEWNWEQGYLMRALWSPPLLCLPASLKQTRSVTWREQTSW